MEEQGGRRRRLVLVPYPLQGHITPTLQLGTILHSRGFSITIAHSHFNSPDTSNHPDFVFLPLSDDSLSKYNHSDDIVAFISNLNLSCKVPLQELLIEMIEKQEKCEELPCIIYDPIMYSAEAVARHLKLPSIMLRTTSVTFALSFYVYPKIQKEGYTPFQDSKSLELVPEFHPFRFKDLTVFNLKSVDDFLQFVTTITNLQTSGMIWNSIDCLEQSSLAQLRQKSQVPFFLIGPMHKLFPFPSSSLLEEDRSCISWLDKQTENSVLYVSFGSMATVEEKEVAEMTWGLANSKQPFLWVIRPGSVLVSESVDLLLDDFKESVGERGCIVKWAPQKEVLAHSAVGGFWTHCGWNSTLESVSEGVPMICRPFSADQKLNGRYVSHVWRVGVELENGFERREIERAIKLLMEEKEGEEIRQRAAELKQELQLSIQKGGSSYNSLNELVELIMSV
ncbi:hypothetical protein EZV62_002795 [Acer yangbiense]|uniref:Glycosyltransferase n=1 Tax=Acer yangbiense TaxID=1000413 RepID=A0A5C7J0P1_9ROSI|nr:hypothetical protein EZV62_002795 [Acer yangbiense]